MTPNGPAAALFDTALADAEAEQWVHGESTTAGTAPGSTATTFISDDGPDGGTQEITIGAVAGEIRVVGSRTYIRGAPQALVDLFGVPAQVAARLGDTWVTLRPGDSEYASVTAGVTLSSFLHETAFSGPVTEARATLAGMAVTVIRGALAASAGKGSGALYVSDGPRPLPLRWSLVQPDGASSATTVTTTTFTRWGDAVAVTPPPGAVALPLAGTITVGSVRPA